MATSIRLDEKTERRLDKLAARTGRTKAYYLRELITGGLDELEEAYLAAATLERVRAGLGCGRCNCGCPIPAVRISPSSAATSQDGSPRLTGPTRRCSTSWMRLWPTSTAEAHAAGWISSPLPCPETSASPGRH